MNIDNLEEHSEEEAQKSLEREEIVLQSNSLHSSD